MPATDIPPSSAGARGGARASAGKSSVELDTGHASATGKDPDFFLVFSLLLFIYELFIRLVELSISPFSAVPPAHSLCLFLNPAHGSASFCRGREKNLSLARARMKRD